MNIDERREKRQNMRRGNKRTKFRTGQRDIDKELETKRKRQRDGDKEIETKRKRHKDRDKDIKTKR